MHGKIAIYLPNLDGGGAERAMLDLARGFALRGVSTDLVLVRAKGVYLTLLPDEVRLVDLCSWRSATALSGLLRYLRTEQPGILLSTLSGTIAGALIAKKLLGKNLRVIVRLATTPAREFAGGICKNRVVGKLVKHLLPSADAIIVHSQEAVDDLMRNHLPGNTTCLVRAINNPTVWPDHAEKASAPVNHPWFKDRSIPVIVTAGRLSMHGQKNHATLLRAFAELTKRRRARLVILGEGPGRSRLTAFAGKLRITDNIDLPGFKLNVFAYMARAAVFVLSSHYEAFANVLVQAMACGTPVVSTDCPNGPRGILENGKYGQLVPVGDWQRLAEAIAATLDNPINPERLIARAKNFSADASLDQYMQLMNEVNRQCDQLP